jgi:hypothetical protein
MKENNSNIKQNLSVMVFPFRIINENKDNDAFDFIDSKIENVSEVSIETLKSKLDNLKIVSDNIVDQKHHNFIKNYIADATVKNDSAFLRVYKLEKPYFAKKNEFIKYNADQHKLYINDIGDVEFANMCYIILNKYAQIGYFIFGLQIQSDEKMSLEALSKSKFFRYYTEESNNEKNNYQYSLRVYEKKDENKNIVSYLSIQKIIKTYFGDLLSHIKFLYRKPINLHLFGKTYTQVFASDSSGQLLFNLLRMPANDEYLSDDLVIPDTDFIQKTNDGILFCGMNEGACVFDCYLTGGLDLFKKYFPSFILAINQREIMIRTNNEISLLNIRDFEFGINDSVIERLKKLKKKINIFQLKQVIYSISFYNEISLFYNNLQNNFNIELLLKDNKQSVMEIHTLLESESQESLIKLEKNRSDRFNWIITLLTIIQCASAIAAIFGYNRISSILLFVSFIPVLMYVLNKITNKYKD